MEAVRGDGRILAVRPAPLTAADAAPALREFERIAPALRTDAPRTRCADRGR
ncbi:MAG: hypothetical protein HOV70_29390 [Streptomyces sp.]|nr:hypothetical protein [Streptomyces sp.]